MKIKVGSLQINNGFSGQYYLPYSIGLLQAYVMANTSDPNRYEFQLPIYKRWLLDECVEYLKDQEVIFFSSYVWNINISSKIAEKLKELDNSKIIVFGGPSVPDNIQGKAEKFLRERPYIDVVVHQEGERAALKILELYEDRNFSSVEGVSFINQDEKYINTIALPRFRDFTQVPSPYLSGVFEPLIEFNPNEKWLASWETNRGCPFACTYCDWGSATNSKVGKMEMDRILAELDWFSKHKIEFIFCCDANFGMLQRDYEIAQKAAENKKKYGYPHVLSVQNTKNARERAYKVQKLLADTGLSKGVTLAMQSVESTTLEAIKRDNISLDDYAELQKRFSKDGIPTYTEFILALPGDTYDSFADGVAHVIQSGQHNRIQFNNLSILPNAEMANPDYMEKYQLLTSDNPIVNIHGSLDETPEDGIYEQQQLVISTSTLPLEEWKRTRAYASMSEFLHFNKLLQIPLLLVNHFGQVDFRTIFEKFLYVDKEQYPTLGEISQSFFEHAEKITQGYPEFIYKKGWLDIYWPPGEYEYIKLSMNSKLEDFYSEARQLLLNLIKDKEIDNLISDAIEFNFKLMRQPFTKNDIKLSLNYDVETMYKNIIKGSDSVQIIEKHTEIKIIRTDKPVNDWLKWMQEVVWYGHRSGAYLYGTVPMEKDIAGHY